MTKSDTGSGLVPDKTGGGGGLRVSSFPDRFPYYAWTGAKSAHSDFVGSKVYACLSVTCHLHFGKMTGSFTSHCGNTGVEQTPNKSQHTKLTLKKKILLPLLPGFELATFQSQVWRSTNMLSWLLKLMTHSRARLF